MEIETALTTLVLAGAGTYDYLTDLDVLTFSALEASVTRVRYRQKSEDATVSAIVLGLQGGEDGKKQFDKLQAAWRKITRDPAPSGDERAEASKSKFMSDFASGGF